MSKGNAQKYWARYRRFAYGHLPGFPARRAVSRTNFPCRVHPSSNQTHSLWALGESRFPPTGVELIWGVLHPSLYIPQNNSQQHILQSVNDSSWNNPTGRNGELQYCQAGGKSLGAGTRISLLVWSVAQPSHASWLGTGNSVPGHAETWSVLGISNEGSPPHPQTSPQSIGSHWGLVVILMRF